MTESKHAGYVAIVGRPNVGKSTLLNRILGKKISITSRKPQTTRHQILGVKTEGHTQTIYVDTPGLHQKLPRKINRYMNQAALSALHDVDVVVFVVDSIHFNEGDEWVLEQLEKIDLPVILAINKTDSLDSNTLLLPHVEKLSKMRAFDSVIPVSALSGKGVEALESAIAKYMPEVEHFYFPEDASSNRDDRFWVSEIIREKLVRSLGQELPYETHVVVDRMSKDEKIIHIDASIYVARESQKSIVIGKGGEKLKSIGMRAREEIEQHLGQKVMLKLWVKIKDKWSDSDRHIQKFGYDNE